MAVNPILTRSGWMNMGRFNVQVLPHDKKPGDFLARVIVRNQGQIMPGSSRVLEQIRDCSDITGINIFIERDATGETPVALKLAESAGIVPSEVADVFSSREFPRGLNYFLIQPGNNPDEPTYPVWTRDLKRSVQVIDGKYSEITPMSFEFVPTLNCIYRCIQCAYRDPKEKMGIWGSNDFDPKFHMTWEHMKLLLERLKEADVQEVLFTGGGEPLMNVHTPQGMGYAGKDLGIKKIGLYTNGALITEKRAGALIDAQPSYIRVSVNAGDRELHQKHHCPLSGNVDYFQRMVDGITFLAAIKQQTGSKTQLGISYLVDDRNAHDVTNGAKLIAAIAGRYPGMIKYMRYTPSVNYFGPEQHSQAMFNATVDRLTAEVAPLLTGAGVEPVFYRHRFSGLYEERPYRECLAAGMYGGVGPGGILYWCCEKLFNPDFSFGSLLDRPLAEIWTSPERQAVIDHVAVAVKGGTDSPCPVVCKPHEHNKVFSQIEYIRQAGRIDVARVWLEQVHAITTGSQRDADPRFFGFAADDAGKKK